MKKFNIGWGLTNSCNMNCQFCYSKGTRVSTTDTKSKDAIWHIDALDDYEDEIELGE
ncbi:MAG: hypothetical protein HFI85_00180 [Clostridia bacterium]|jgi:MoaA/NifB/PqqE/SkfB family radical SAM enzyme|nr:hypothetical protein [Clostridia bacterium]